MARAPSINQFRKSFGAFPKVPGAWNGDAYCYHPHGVIMRPMVYTDHHSINGACSAEVMTDPQSAIRPIASGRDASIYGSTSQCIPRVVSGELVTVYDSGEWVGPDGPWRAQMRKDMAFVMRAKRAQRRAEALEREQSRRSAELARMEAFADAERAFSVSA